MGEGSYWIKAEKTVFRNNKEIKIKKFSELINLREGEKQKVITKSKGFVSGV